jgi:hypothetical protein
VKTKSLINGLKRSIFGILWLLGTLGMVWIYNNTNAETTYHKIYAPENISRNDAFRGYDVKEVSMAEFQQLPKNSPKVLRVDDPGSKNEIQLIYYGKSDKYLGNVKALQKIANPQKTPPSCFTGIQSYCQMAGSK